MSNAWQIAYDNDTGHDDGGFYEWWDVTDGNRSFRCDSEEAAYYLCDLLNETENDQEI